MTKIGKQSEIISLSNVTIKTISSLSHRKYRKELHLFIAEGIRVCKEALDNGWSFKYFLFDKSNVDNILINELINKIISKGGNIIGVTPDILKKISHLCNCFEMSALQDGEIILEVLVKHFEFLPKLRPPLSGPLFSQAGSHATQ